MGHYYYHMFSGACVGTAKRFTIYYNIIITPITYQPYNIILFKTYRSVGSVKDWDFGSDAVTSAAVDMRQMASFFCTFVRE